MRNATRGRDLATHARAATTMWTRFMGLMGKDSLPAGGGLIIRPCNSIHSFFMRFVFDAVFVGGDAQVVHVVHEMKRRRGTKLVRGAKCVIELPAGVLRATETGIGDHIEIEAA